MTEPPDDPEDGAGGAGEDTPNAADSTLTPAVAKPQDVAADSTQKIPAQRQPDERTGPVQPALPGLEFGEDDSAWVGPEGLAALIATRQEFTADNLRRIAGVPESRNRVGGLFLTAAARGDIVPVGITRSTSQSRHAGKLTIWRAAA